MVAKVISGKTIAGVLRYNEKKVEKGHAVLLTAEKFGCDGNDLSYSEKLARFRLLTRLRPKVKTNAVHISLNFDKEDMLHKDKLLRITETYMKGIGFGDQPYMVYQHFDAAHPHIHIVTTNVTEEGERIDMHNIGKTKSEPARKMIEQDFGLIPAESKKKKEEYVLQKVNLEKVKYGEVETKAAISNIVREVVRSYKFTNLPALDAILRQFGITADGGKPGSRLYDKHGLVYSLLNEDGGRIGVPVKASDIYSKPTKATLEKKYTLSAIMRQPYEQRVKGAIDNVLRGTHMISSTEEFAAELEKKGIHVAFVRGATGTPIDFLYVDNRTRVVFSSNDLGEAYGVAGITRRLEAPELKDYREARWNKEYVKKVLEATNFSGGFQTVLTQWLQQGVMVHAHTSEDGVTRYWLAIPGIKSQNMMPASEKISAYLRANRMHDRESTFILERVKSVKPLASVNVSSNSSHNPIIEWVTLMTKEMLSMLASIVKEAFSLTRGNSHVPHQFLQQSRKKRNKKRLD
jgi:hypothetical protein